MISRAGGGWQTTTADLALILFLVVSVASAEPRTPPVHTTTMGAPLLEASPPAAVYRATPGTSLSQWLRSQAPDERQVATVLVRRATPGPSPIMDQGLAFLDQIEATGRAGRLLVERGTTDEVAVVLAYDGGQNSGMSLAAH